jgi:predicted ATPase
VVIDLHCHTKKAKTGDSGREVDVATFRAKIEEHNVGIVAVTNHNLFSLTQYESFCSACDKTLILPGVEFDVFGDKSGTSRRGHVIVIVDNTKAREFSPFVARVCNGKQPDEFSITIDDLVSELNSFDRSLVIFHYRKDPSLSSQDISFFKNNCSKSVAILEPSNSRKAGIIVNFENETSWFGSDNHEWSNYPGKELPDCLFKISSFNALFTLLSKDQNAILLKTLMSPKGPTQYEITPFSDLDLKLSLFNDVNVIFGSKATGKTEMLKSLEQKMVEGGKKVGTFYIEDKNEGLKKFAAYQPTDAEISNFNAHSCEVEFENIKTWKWNAIPTLKSFLNYAKTSENNTIIQKLKITSATFTEFISETEMSDKKKALDKNRSSIESVICLEKKGFSKIEEEQLRILLAKLDENYCREFLDQLFEFEAKKLEKHAIDFFSKEISKSQNISKKPSSVGLMQVFQDSYELNRCLSAINDNLDYSITIPKKPIGRLQKKGMVYLQTAVGFKAQEKSSHNEMTSRKYFNKDANMKSYVEFDKTIKKLIEQDVSAEDYLSTLKALQDKIVGGISNLKFFLNYSNKLICGKNNDFKPSNGEVSILMVDSVLHGKDCDALILDEPDSGMGADYINDVLIKDIIDAAKQNVIVIISTHDPNLVVRTHPYLCVFRDKNEDDVYKTYIGSSFEDWMINPEDESDKVAWVEKCISKCEGGDSAITERERTYGHY